MRRGTTLKQRTEKELVIERKMVTHHDVLSWDLDKCVGCQLGPKICPVDSLTHVEGTIVDGRLATKLLVDVDPETCMLCGMCVAICPVKAITLTLDGEPNNPVLAYETFPVLAESNTFDREAFDWTLRELVLGNCPTKSIKYAAAENTMVVDDETCIHCRQCEVASDGAFTVQQAWEGTVILRREHCVEGCLACADVCPTRALTIDDEGELQLADYYCIKCGACVQICPVDPIIEDYEVTLQSQGVTTTKTLQRVSNVEELPIWVERWRVRHAPVQSGSWVIALAKLADDKANMLEIEQKRAIKRRDLIVALEGNKELREREAERRERLLKALVGGEQHI